MGETNITKKLAGRVAILRIIFGILWGIDAAFKWTPTFRKGYMGQINSAAIGQQSWLHWWFSFWIKFLSHNPHFFAVLTAIIESLIAVALITGLARRATYLWAIVFSLLIWSVAEGFGGPYSNTSTDIGTAIMYAVVFFALYGLERMAKPPRWSIDNYINKHLHWWYIISNP